MQAQQTGDVGSILRQVAHQLYGNQGGSVPPEALREAEAILAQLKSQPGGNKNATKSTLQQCPQLELTTAMKVQGVFGEYDIKTLEIL